jgi:hypothetical protein
MPRWRVTSAGALWLLAACSPAPAVEASPPPSPPPATAAWTSTVGTVRSLVDAGRYADADSTLGAFEIRYAGTPESAEARYWRALVQLDPVNPQGTPRSALGAIDAYLAGGMEQPRYTEALVLRRVASRLLEPRRAVLPVGVDSTTPAVAPEVERLRIAEDSIRALRAELERAEAELDRIRRRIRPTPPPAG